MMSRTKAMRVVLCLLIFASTLIASTLVNAFQEGWESSTVGTYVPTSHDNLPLPLIPADEGDWLLGDTVSEFPECGATPHRAEILLNGGNRSLRLTSNDSNSSCADNVWVNLFEIPPLNINPGFSVPLTSDTVISFEESGNLINPESGSPNCVLPPCGDTISLTLEDNRGNMLAYILQRAPDAVPNEVRSYYREVFLDPDADLYARNLFADFNTIPDFNPSGVTIRTVAFEVSSHGTGTVDKICIDTSGCAPNQLVVVPDVVGLTQSAAEAAIAAATLDVGSVKLQSSLTVPAGSVISQAPSAGNHVAPGTEVNLVVSSGVPVSADFSADPTSGAVPLTVSFSDQSAGNITSWNWSFGDGASSTMQNPSHTYTNEGKYSVSLSVSGPGGSDTETKNQYILVIKVFKLLSSDGAPNDSFGCSVAMSGDYAIVGASGKYVNGASTSGAAYIFERNASDWDEVAAIIPGGDAWDAIGHSVSISGDYAIAGAYGDDDNGSNAGAAYIIQKSGSNWSQGPKLTPSDAAADDLFGWSVSISGDYAIVGAIYDDDKGSDSGAAYIFQRSGSNWSQVDKLTADDGAAGDMFGSSVSMYGDYAIVGAVNNDAKGFDSGATYVFQRSGSNWIQVDKLTASDGFHEDRLGSSVSISGDYSIVGARGDDDNGSSSGSAYIFKRSGNDWNQVAKLTADDGAANDDFGISVSISGDYAIVGAFGTGDLVGSAYVFEKSSGSWSQVARLNVGDGEAGDRFGWSVAISNDDIIVGADGNDDQGRFSGSAYIFEYIFDPPIPGNRAMPWIPSLLLYQ